MKGLLKGLRYISQIFDAKEPEMKIGNPTDVKHVAHIGWDNASSVTAPSWMQDFSKAAAPGVSRGCGTEPSQPRGGERDPGGEGGASGKTERPRRTSKGGKGAGGSEAKRRDRRVAKAEAEAEGGEGDAATKQRRRKPRASREGTSSGGTGCGAAAAPGVEDDRNCF